MAENSKIEWTDHTFNPWVGCSKVSAGCANCYAERDFDVRRGFAKWGPGGSRVVTSEGNWRKPLAWNRAAAKLGKKSRVFCASLADVFEGATMPAEALEGVEAARLALWELVEATPWLIWMFLTKRPENVMALIPEWWRGGLPGNVWMGTSVEDQATADVRIPEILLVPTAVRFLSCEPLLGPVDLSGFGRVDWVIAGGESGPKARPVDYDWLRLLRDACGLKGVPFFFKQWGEFDERGKRVGKRAAGRLLFGETWDQIPEEAQGELRDSIDKIRSDLDILEDRFEKQVDIFISRFDGGCECN